MSSILLLLAAALCCGSVRAAVPHQINYQGYLTNPGGTPVNTSVSMTFKLWDQLTNGNVLHTETQSVTVTNGVFNVVLGTAATLNAQFDIPYFLGVTVAPDVVEMAPRQAVVASPYAIRSATTEALAANGTNCAPGQFATGVDAQGNAEGCAAPVSGGTVTSITAGTGLSGGTITTTGTIAADATYLQRRVSGSCTVGSYIRAIALDGTVTCATDANSGGTVTNVTASSPLASSGGTTPNLALTGVVPLANIPDLGAGYVRNTATLQNPGTFNISGNGLIGGNLGVGAVNPAVTRLDVAGSGWFRADANGLAASAAQGVRVFYDTFSGTGSVFAYDYGTLNPLNLTLQSPGGNVGIGTTTAGSKLTVAGKIESTSGGVKFPDGTTQATAALVPYAFNPLGNTLTTVDGAGSVGQFTSITLGADGLPVISYFDSTNGDLKVAKCVNAACTGASTLTTVDSASFVGQYTSITLGADGLPVISYYDQTNGNLKVAKCVNAACTGASTLTTVDSAGDVGRYTSITLGADGLPVISYFDGTNGDLKVAKCVNAACTGASTRTTVDSAGFVGLYTSITLGADGLPVISYRDVTNGVLKVAKCTSATCVPFVRRR